MRVRGGKRTEGDTNKHEELVELALRIPGKKAVSQMMNYEIEQVLQCLVTDLTAHNTHLQPPEHITGQWYLMSEFILMRDIFSCVLSYENREKTEGWATAWVMPILNQKFFRAWSHDASKTNPDAHMIWTSHYSAFTVWWGHQESCYSTSVK